ncbi:MAG: hypothetical protein ACKOOC_05080 [Cyanobium sp.]
MVLGILSTHYRGPLGRWGDLRQPRQTWLAALLAHLQHPSPRGSLEYHRL